VDDITPAVQITYELAPFFLAMLLAYILRFMLAYVLALLAFGASGRMRCSTYMTRPVPVRRAGSALACCPGLQTAAL
jgi:hypothetical protein